IEVGLCFEQVEDRRSARPVAGLLHAVVLARDLHLLARKIGRCTGRRETVISCDHVALHRALGGIARCPENVPVHARLTDQVLPLEVVPYWERCRQGELRALGARRVEAIAVRAPDPRPTEAWQARAQPPSGAPPGPAAWTRSRATRSSSVPASTA